MENELEFPAVLDRVKAVFADGVVLILLMFLVTYTFSLFENVSQYARMFAFVFIFLLYDPLLTSIIGGTLGHMAFGLRVKRDRNMSKNILFPLAVLRFIDKALLGWVSLLTVFGSEKRKTIHDLLVGSVVVYNTMLMGEMVTNPDLKTEN